ncbi:MAG: 2-dehydro-3-deoxygalactonokinase [Verrucomicrobia bacterium]|nr:2-dehydro-3-deoxygalactonokinase [Verrucomicrobiota bacterium]
MSDCAICVDMGTTNTRVWFVRGAEVLARAQSSVGVRDTARDGTSVRIRLALRDLIREVRERVCSRGIAAEPAAILGAGMITSPSGLAEIPHVAAPAGTQELAAAVRRYNFPDVTDLPILLVPGVRSGSQSVARDMIGEVDVMRGEETLCLGLVALGRVRTPGTVLNLGSHWKAIRLDTQGRIQSSRTSLSGELIHAAQTQTILASAVPRERPSSLDAAWSEAGMSEQRNSGLARALFCVRLLELNQIGTPEQRLSFLAGVFVAADFEALLRQGFFKAGSSVSITGGGAIADAWRAAFKKASVHSVALHESDVEAGLLAGLRAVIEASRDTSQA